ncbi:transposase [Fructilactobacillus sanfranciscensis]|nr:transposase [Fructilactobacillus sanfranciscensis]
MNRFLAENHRLTIILKALQVPRRTYYNWINYTPNYRKMLEEKVKPFLKEAWSKNYKAYGAPRFKVALQRELGINFSIRRITRLMKELGIRSLMCRRFKKPGTHIDYDQRPNLIKNLSGKSIWRADITYLQLENGVWVYLSTVFDDQTYKILSQKVSKHMTSKLVSHTLIEALKKNKKPEYLHSDMGSQYTSSIFEHVLEGHEIRHSYLQKGHPYDNGPIEAFHSILKREFAFQTRFTSFEDVVLKTENYIHWYNTERIRIAV